MIYKLISNDSDASLEVEQISEQTVELKISDIANDDAQLYCNLNKSQLYKLIGVLHLIHKELDNSSDNKNPF